jgi:hypothetical protein
LDLSDLDVVDSSLRIQDDLVLLYGGSRWWLLFLVDRIKNVLLNGR